MLEPTSSPPPSIVTLADQCNVIRDKSSAATPAATVQDDAPGGRCNVLRDKPSASPTTAAVIELRVRNHPGTMAHVTGLFARRGFNLEAIVCVPVADGATSCMLLLVADEPRLEQVERQLAKLYDVLTIRHRQDLTREFFTRLGPSAQSPTAV